MASKDKPMTSTKLRKLCRFALLLSLSVSSGAGILSCSNQQEQQNHSQQGTPQNPYTIVWYMIGTPQTDTQMVIDKLNEYLVPKIGARVEFHQIDWPNYDQKMKMITMTGQPYDIAFSAGWTNNYTLQASRGAFYPLNDLLKKYGQGIIKNVNPEFLRGAQVNGELYGIPANKEIGKQLVYRINQQWLDGVGMKMSQFKSYAELDTLKSIIPFMAAVKKKYHNILPYAAFGNTEYSMGNVEFISGVLPGALRIGDKNMKIYNQYEDPEFTKYFTVYHELYKKGYIGADAAQIKDNPSLITSGKWAVGNAEYMPFAENLWSLSSGYPIAAIPAYRPLITSQTVTGSLQTISINARRPDIDMKFLNLVNSDPYVRNLLQMGIESVHYVKIGPNRIRFLPRKQSSYDMPGFAIGNMFLTYLLDGDPSDKWAQFQKWNNSAVASPALGFSFNITPVSSIYAAISTVTMKYRAGLFTGQNDPAVYLPMFNKELKEAGMDKLIAEEQRQLDAWRARIK